MVASRRKSACLLRERIDCGVLVKSSSDVGKEGGVFDTGLAVAYVLQLLSSNVLLSSN